MSETRTFKDRDAAIEYINSITSGSATLLSEITAELGSEYHQLWLDAGAVHWASEDEDGGPWNVDSMAAAEALEILEAGACWMVWERLANPATAYADYPDADDRRAADQAVADELLQVRLAALPADLADADQHIQHQIATARIHQMVLGLTRSALVRTQDTGDRGWQAQVSRTLRLSTATVANLANRYPGQS